MSAQIENLKESIRQLELLANAGTQSPKGQTLGLELSSILLNLTIDNQTVQLDVESFWKIFAEMKDLEATKLFSAEELQRTLRILLEENSVFQRLA